MEPADWEFMNEWKVISLDFNKFSQSALSWLYNYGFSVNNGVTGIGSLLQGNNCYFSLWLRFGNFGQPGSLSDLPPGEFYPCCRLLENSYVSLGTRNRTTQLVVRTTPLLNIDTNATLTYSTAIGWFVDLPPADSPF